ncbi:unnamed protein product [Schistosoma curassoni]|uniref:Uncharacterized protein n=1 Tax=Schistosoma curassoni TaxID=6186 RepID=A0A183KCY1_9TREM|nr:unnamed protein product [Schistosoma curassoni]
MKAKTTAANWKVTIKTRHTVYTTRLQGSCLESTNCTRPPHFPQHRAQKKTIPTRGIKIANRRPTTRHMPYPKYVVTTGSMLLYASLEW